MEGSRSYKDTNDSDNISNSDKDNSSNMEVTYE